MRIVASVDDTKPGPDGVRTRRRVPPEKARAYRARLAALQTRAPDTLRARIRRELRAAADQAAPR